MLVPFVPMAESRKNELQIILAESNKILNCYYDSIIQNGFRTTCEKKISRLDLLNSIVSFYKNNSKSDFELREGVIPNSDVVRIARIKDVEWEVLTSLGGLIAKIINKKSRYLKDSSISKEDLESEAVRSFISSLCSYTDASICFSTYFYVCMNRHINNLCNLTTPLSRLPKKAILLKKKYNEAKRNSGEGASFEEIIKSMNISNKDLKVLRSALDSYNVCNHDESKNYSKCCSSVDGSKQYGISSKFENEEGLIDNNQLDDLKVNLSELEKAVLEGVLNSSHKLGINSIAKTLINPKTGKPFTRMAVTYAWRRVKEKIRTFRKVA